MAAQPVKLGGLGLRSNAETRLAAFVGGVEMALPYLVEGDHGEEVLCPQLAQVIGRVGGQQRWSDFLAAGSRTAQEFRLAWEELRGEALDIWGYLQEVPSGPLASSAAAAGGTNLDGSTRSSIVHQREMLRHKLIAKALKAYPDRDARPVTAFPNIADDKCAGRWLLAIPSPELGMSSPVFQEAMSAHLCLPSPAIRDGGWLGREVPGARGGVEIDLFGDAVVNCSSVPGDTWRKRHDNIKQHVVKEAALSGISVDCEVYGLFSDLLPAALTQEGGELHMARARQGKVPDFRFLLPTPEGPTPCLAELKIVGAGRTWYPRGSAGKGTDRRADRLPHEYSKKLSDLDARFLGAQPWHHGQPEPPPGPLLSRFRSLGGIDQGRLVAGPWGDISADFHHLLPLFAESRCAALGRAAGWEGEAEGMLGKVMGDTRRATSVVIVRSQALCLLERLAQLGPGARAAAQRRQATLQLEERRRRERQAYALAFERRGLSRVGRAFVT